MINELLASDLDNKVLYQQGGLHKQLMLISEQYGFVVPFSDGDVLVEEALAQNAMNLMEINDMLISFTDKHEWHFCYSDKTVVYHHYQLALTELKALDSEKNRQNESDGVTQKGFYTMINKALNHGASDIHISLTEDSQASIYYRINGVIDTTPEKKSRTECMTIIGGAFEWDGALNAASEFNMDSNNSTAIENIPVNLHGEMREVEVRLFYRSMTKHDKVCTIRILNTGTKIKSLKEIGLAPSEVAVMQSAIRMANGMILVSGPTGSGKSTLLVSVVSEKPEEKVVHTLEDPIESKMPDPLIFQGQMSDNVEKDIKDYMRLDLEIGVVGEMRTGAQVKTALGLARTGHLILSTIHANDTVTIIERLLDMGMDRFELSEKNLLRVLTAQRLVPLLCEHCKEVISDADLARWRPITTPDIYERLIEHRLSIFKKNEHGCRECNKRGQSGRQIVFEYTVVDQEARKFIRKGDTQGWVNSLKNRGWQSLSDKTWKLILAGKVDPDVADGIVQDVIVNTEQPWNYANV